MSSAVSQVPPGRKLSEQPKLEFTGQVLPIAYAPLGCSQIQSFIPLSMEDNYVVWGITHCLSALFYLIFYSLKLILHLT